MSINERFKVLIRQLGLNNNSFAKEVGVSGTVIYNIVSEKGRKNHPSFDVLEKVLLAFDNVDANWLIRGDGGIFIDLCEEDPEIYSINKGEGSRNIYQLLEDLNKKIASVQQEVEDLKNNRR